MKNSGTSRFDIGRVFGALKKVFLLIVAVFILGAFLFNNRGLISWYKYAMERERIESELDSLKAEEVRLRNEIEKLKFAPEYLEKLAREKYGMAKEGEKVYKIVPEEEDKKQE